MDCAYVAALIIVEMIQTSPGAGHDRMLSFITYAVFEAIGEAERRLGGFRHAHRVSSN
jgi:hypothetical protein